MPSPTPMPTLKPGGIAIALPGVHPGELKRSGIEKTDRIRLTEKISHSVELSMKKVLAIRKSCY